MRRCAWPDCAWRTPASSQFQNRVQRAAGRRRCGAALGDADPRVAIQAMLSVRRAALPDAKKLIQATAAASASAGVYAINEQLWDDAEERGSADHSPARRQRTQVLSCAAATLYNSVCFACHGTDGRGAPMPGAEGRTHRAVAGRLAHGCSAMNAPRLPSVLHGLQGPVDGVDYGAPMVPMNSYSDAELAGVLTYIRNSFGNRAPAVEAAAVAARRAADAAHANYWTLAELTDADPGAWHFARPVQAPRRVKARAPTWRRARAHRSKPLLDGDPKTGYVTRGRQAVPRGVAHGRTTRAQQDHRGSTSTRGVKMHGRQGSWAGRRSYSVEVSDDGKTWTMVAPRVVGEPHARLNLPRRLKPGTCASPTEKEGWQPWVIKELNLYGEEG